MDQPTQHPSQPGDEGDEPYQPADQPELIPLPASVFLSLAILSTFLMDFTTSEPQKNGDQVSYD